MIKLLRRLSLRNQIILSTLFCFIIFFLLYFIYLAIIIDTYFYKNYTVLANAGYWLIAIILCLFALSFLVEKITDPLEKFIGYIKEFDSINFEELKNTMINRDYYKLTQSLNELQHNLLVTIDELKQKNLEIERLVEEQKQDYIYKKSLVTSLSHDIKTPLTIIHTTISGIIDGIFPQEDVKKELDNVVKEIETTNNMLMDMISIYRMDNEISSQQIEQFSLIDIINEITDNFQKLFLKYQQTLYLNLPNDVSIVADKKQFERVLNNLVLNAIIHSPMGNEIRINIITSSQTNILEIINTGITIPQTDIKQIFEPFYRIDKSRTKKDDYGNGLGLYIAREICKKNHFELGVINLDNAVKFFIIIPNIEKQSIHK